MYWKTKYNVNFFYRPNVRENKKYQVLHIITHKFFCIHNLVENWIHFLLMFRFFFALCLAILKQSRHVLFLHVTFVWCYIKSFNNTLLKGKACYVCVAKKPICIEHKKKYDLVFVFCCTIVTWWKFTFIMLQRKLKHFLKEWTLGIWLRDKYSNFRFKICIMQQSIYAR